MGLGISVAIGDSGRQIRLQQLHILPSANGYGAVGPTDFAQRLPSLVERLIGGGLPVLLREVRSNIVPPIAYFGLFHSDPKTVRDVCVQGSALVVCWFSERLAWSVPELAAEALAGVDWDAHAADFHSEW